MEIRRHRRRGRLRAIFLRKTSRRGFACATILNKVLMMWRAATAAIAGPISEPR
jgi:hypothetical protein